MLGLFSKKKKQAKTLEVDQVIHRLADLSPPSTLVFLEQTAGGRKVDENLGRAFFLQRDKKLYSEANHIYITTPEDMKVGRDANFSGKGELISLQFMHRRVPHKLECRVIGRFRLLPEVTEILDFKAKSAYKLSPTSVIRKEDKRNFLRYTLKNYGDTRIPITTRVTFDTFLKRTNKEAASEGAPPIELADLRPISTQPQPQQADHPFTAREAMEEFREIMVQRPAGDRRIHLTKIVKGEARGNRKPKDDVYLLGYVDVLGLEQEMKREVIYTKKSEKSDYKKDNPYNLHPGDKVLAQFSQDGYYSMSCEVLGDRTQNEVLRPRGLIKKETGLKVELVEYSVGGALLEADPELLRLMLGKRCPPEVEKEETYSSKFWDYMFADMKRHLIHLTFYPKFHFPDKLKEFQPELPFSLPIVAQVVRPHVIRNKRLLQLGLRFVYDQESIAMDADALVNWKLIRGMRDNVYFTAVHASLSKLYGFLEHQSTMRTRALER